MPAARVLAVAPGSPAAVAGLTPGDEIVAMGGEALSDVIGYQVRADDAHVELDVRRGGLERSVEIRKEVGAPLGLELASAVFDRVRTCDNHCPFCFIHQLPKGMRRSLSVQDDDYRLSFLYGNFTTLTRFTEADLERVVDERLGPLYVSIHATDPDLRARLLRNRRGATSLRWLRALLDAGIEVHGQVVLCPELNDGDSLDDTMLGILERYPELASVGVVPLGVSAHNREPELRPHTRVEAAAAVEQIEAWQARFVRAIGRRCAFASDELYLLAGLPFPALSDYEGAPQHENGIGIARTFEEEARRATAGEEIIGVGVRSGFFASVDGAPAVGYRAERTGTPVDFVQMARTDRAVTILTGRYAEPLLRRLASDAVRVLDGNRDVAVLGVDNTFFGGNIAVAGLLTGADVARALDAQPRDRRYVLPDVMLSEGRFLDGRTPADLPREVEVVGSDGVAFVRALRGD